jgi:hypothetical protein
MTFMQPTTKYLRQRWVSHRVDPEYFGSANFGRGQEALEAEFDAWLAERDRQTAERAHDEGFMEALDYYRVDDHVSDGPQGNPYRASETEPPMCSECGAPLSHCGCEL